MKLWLKIVLFSILGIGAIVGLTFAFGYGNVFYTLTVGKAKQDAQREVFEHTQSYMEGKRQEATKSRFEWNKAETKEDKLAIESMIRHSNANTDIHATYPNAELRTWVDKCLQGTHTYPADLE